MSDHAHVHPEATSFVAKHVFSKDHKVIAKQFLWLGLFGLALGGSMAMLMRWTLANPGVPVPLVGGFLFPTTGGVIPPDSYASLFTLHGTIMIFFAITPLLIGCFGNFCIPLMIGARDMVFPTLNMLSFWVAFAAATVMVWSFFVPMGGAASGWTAYPTLSTNVGLPGLGQTLWAVSVFLLGVSSIMGAVNYITTVIRLRAPGMGYFDMPLTVWGLWLTAILNALFVPVIASALMLLFFDRVFGTTFFVAGSAIIEGTGDPILYQHLFWIFGHPEVYILILPAWGIVSDLLSFHSRKPAYGYKITALGMTAVCVMSALVYGHHMFTTGMSPLLGQSFMVLTMIISVPAEMFFLNWLHTIWKGKLRLNPPMLFSLGVVFVFGLGGLTGLPLAALGTDLYLHDTYFVVGHFHLTMAAAAFLGFFAGLYHWFPKMTGRSYNRTLATIHFWGSVIPITVIFCLMLVQGWAGMHRRIYDHNVYDYLQKLAPLTKIISHAAFTLGIMQLAFIVNFFRSWFAGAPAADNPWELGTLEWSTASPPVHHNFDHIPVVFRGPHEFNNPKYGDVGRDWMTQWETHPADASAEERIALTHTMPETEPAHG
jgi:cytochrome c oxidase subunit 1